MRFSVKLLGFLAGLLSCWICRGAPTNIFGISLVANPSPTVLVGQQLVYTIQVTNNASGVLGTVIISNVIPSGVIVSSVSATIGTVQSSSTAVVDSIFELGSGQVAQLIITNVPSVAGLLTNTVTVFASGTTNVVATSVVNAVAGQADLGVVLTGATNGALAFDQISFELTVTNGGPSIVGNPLVQVSIPTNLALLNVIPSTSGGVTNAILYLALTSLGVTNAQTLQLFFQPTNEFTNALVATVSADGLIDTNLANNTFTLPLVVAPPPPGKVTLTVLSASAVLNLQTGLMEETVRVTNIGTNAIAATRVTLPGTTNVLANASGTNGLDPFVTIISSLAPQQSVDFVLEYSVPQRTLTVLPTLTATPVLVPQQTIPAGTWIPISRWINISTNRFLLEFPATLGARYTVVYADDASFSNARPAVPSFVAPGDRVQWIDHGPPNTAAFATNYLLQLTNIISSTVTNASGTNVTTYSNVVFTVFTNSTAVPTTGLVLSTNAGARFYRIFSNP